MTPLNAERNIKFISTGKQAKTVRHDHRGTITTLSACGHAWIPRPVKRSKMYYTIYKCIVFELTLFIVPFFLHAPPRFDLFYEWPAVARRCDHRPHRGRGVMLESRSVACRVAVLCSIVGSRMMFLRKLSFTLLQKLQASVCLTYMYVHRISSINITVHTFIVWKNCLRYGDPPVCSDVSSRTTEKKKSGLMT